MKKYYLIKYNSSNCFGANIINEEVYNDIKEKLGVIYEYIIFEDITGKRIRLNKTTLDYITLEEIIEKSDKQ